MTLADIIDRISTDLGALLYQDRDTHITLIKTDVLNKLGAVEPPVKEFISLPQAEFIEQFGERDLGGLYSRGIEEIYLALSDKPLLEITNKVMYGANAIISLLHHNDDGVTIGILLCRDGTYWREVHLGQEQPNPNVPDKPCEEK